MPFSLIEPEATETALIVEIPHAGLQMDAESMAYTIAPCRCIAQDADLLVSELFKTAPSMGAHLLYSKLSRYVCDLNRSAEEFDSLTSPGGSASSAPHGVVWRTTTSGRPAIQEPLPSSEVQRRLNFFYHPYHQALDSLILAKKKKFGFAIVLCAHSMPSLGRLGERRADVVPGSRGGTTCSKRILGACDQAAREARYDVAHDTPYRGGYTTVHHGKPQDNVHTLQIELARRIYMNESSLVRSEERFAACENFCLSLVKTLGTLQL